MSPEKAGVGVLAAIVAFAATTSLNAQQPRPLPRIPPPVTTGLTLISPKSIAIGRDDWIVVGDESPARVLSLDSNGALLRVIGREGGGPGEFQSPVVGAGSVLVVNDPQLKRLSAFDRTGQLLWTKPGTCCRSRPIRVDETGRIYVVASPLAIGGGLLLDEMIVFSSAGTPVDTVLVPGFGGEERKEWRLVSKQAALSAAVPFVPEQYFAITRTGAVVWGHSSSYILMEGRDASVPQRTIRRPWTAPELSASERLRARDAKVAHFTQFVDKATLEHSFRLTDVPNRAPAFFGLDIDECGRWWVLRTSPHMNGPALFDVLSSAGIPIVTASIPDRLFGDALWRVGKTRMAAIIEDATGAPAVGVYLLTGVPACARN